MKAVGTTVKVAGTTVKVVGIMKVVGTTVKAVTIVKAVVLVCMHAHTCVCVCDSLLANKQLDGALLVLVYVLVVGLWQQTCAPSARGYVNRVDELQSTFE